MKKTLLALVLLAAFAPFALAQGGRLEQVRDSVNTAESESDKQKPTTPHSKDDAEDTSDSSGGDLSSFLGGVGYVAAQGTYYFASALVMSPFCIPQLIIEGKRPTDGGLFPRYPYKGDQLGYLSFEESESEDAVPRGLWAGRFSLENGNDFDGLNRVASQLFFETASRFGVQARVELLTEDLDCGCTDHSWLSSYELTYRFAQNTNIQMYAGLGLRVFDDAFDTHYGWNFVYGADIFPAKPWVLSFSLDAGSAGETGVFRARGTVGYLYRGFETYAGYDHLNIGGVELGTWLAGIRLWF